MVQPHPAPDPLFFSFQQALAGRYSIDRELGRGGMGIVYLAREVHLDRSVAIKLLPPERAAEPGLTVALERPGAPAGPRSERLEGRTSRSLTRRIAWMAVAPAPQGRIH
jgi:serine/threonine protein kinase